MRSPAICASMLASTAAFRALPMVPSLTQPTHGPWPYRQPVMALPTIGAAAVWPTAAASGTAAATLQLMLTSLLRRSPDKALSTRPGLRAYRIVAFAYTLLLTVVGGAVFLNPARWPADAATAMLKGDGTARFLGAVLFGELVLWDLPCAIWIPKLRRLDFLLHHAFLAIGPALVAMRYLPLFYYTWFIGLSEASSVFLAANDYFAELGEDVSAHDESSPRLPHLAKWRDGTQMAAAGAFVAVRVCGWAVAVWLLFRDTIAVLPLAGSLGVRGFLRLQLLMAAGFYALQLTWFTQLIAYTRKSGLGGSVPE